MANEITFRGGAFISSFPFEQKDLVKSAGFWWHDLYNCRNKTRGCKACSLNLHKVWWTPFVEKAARLLDACDEAARKALEPHLATVGASKATNGTRDLNRPAGLEYLPYQKASIEYALTRKGTLIADEMGLGKTIQALGVINNDTEIKTTIVVCPASLRLNWLREASKWLTDRRNIMLPDQFFYVVDSPAPVPAEACFVIVNYDRIKDKVFESLMARKWDCLIVDEAHYLKEEKAKRTIAVLGKRPSWRKDSMGQWVQTKPGIPGLIDAIQRRVMLLTGTPVLNRPIEAFSLLHALDPKTWASRSKFAARYCDAYHNGYGWDYKGANKARLPELQERLRSTIMVRRLKADVLTELPPKRRQVVPLPMNGGSAAVQAEQAAWSRHEEAMEELQAAVDLALVSGDKEAYAQAVAALRQGAKIAFTEIAAARHDVAMAKVEKVVEHVQNMLDSGITKIVLWAHHHDVLDALTSQLNAMLADGRTDLTERQAMVDAFQTDPDKHVFVCGLHAMAEGHTLTAASHVVFAELDWTPAKMSQCEDRCHRIGQQNSVLVQHLVLDGSLDCKMAYALVEKQDIADKMLDKDPRLEVPTVPTSTRIAHPSKYPAATDDQRKAAAQAMQLLAGMCDGALRKDEMGFNRLDTRTGKQLAERSLRRPMTDGEVWLSTRFATKYHRQLPIALLTSLGVVK